MLPAHAAMAEKVNSITALEKIEEVKQEVVYHAATLKQVEATLLESFQKKNKTKKGKEEGHALFGGFGGRFHHVGGGVTEGFASRVGQAGSVIRGKITQGLGGEIP